MIKKWKCEYMSEEKEPIIRKNMADGWDTWGNEVTNTIELL